MTAASNRPQGHDPKGMTMTHQQDVADMLAIIEDAQAAATVRTSLIDEPMTSILRERAARLAVRAERHATHPFIDNFWRQVR